MEKFPRILPLRPNAPNVNNNKMADTGDLVEERENEVTQKTNQIYTQAAKSNCPLMNRHKVRLPSPPNEAAQSTSLIKSTPITDHPAAKTNTETSPDTTYEIVQNKRKRRENQED